MNELKNLDLTKLKIGFSENPKFDEVSDSIYDGIKIIRAVYVLFIGPFDFREILAALSEKEGFEEIKRDFPIFLQQFEQLNKKTAIQALNDVDVRLESEGIEIDFVTFYVLKVLRLLSLGYAVAKTIKNRALESYKDTKDFIDIAKATFPKQSSISN